MQADLYPAIRKLAADGVFGDVKFEKVERDDTDSGAQFASTITFVKMTVEGGQVLPLVVKQTIADANYRVARNCDTMFHNEVTMYKEIIPALGVDDAIFPKMYYGVATNGADSDGDIVVLENMTYRHFRLAKSIEKKPFLDIDHITIAIKKIAEFHSLSYILKHENIDKFKLITTKLKDLPPPVDSGFELMFIAAIGNGMQPLLKNKTAVDSLTKCLNILKTPFKIKKLISLPEEPFGVLCHGDFCANNIIYKYDKSGIPINCAFFDFQTSQYASPAIDLFFFLYMHTTSDLRRKYWDDILKLYWDTLRTKVPSHINIPNFEEFLKHFAERAIYGYMICSFFLPPMTMGTPPKYEEIFSLPLEERRATLLSLGGDEGHHLVSEIASHLLHKGYIESFIEFCKKNSINC